MAVVVGKTDSQIAALAPVQSVAGMAGDVVLTTSDISGLDTALSEKADLVGGVVPSSQIPAIAITEYLGAVADETAMLALDGDQGDWCIRTDSSTAWVLSADDSSLISSWIQIPHPQSTVLSVNGQTGVIVLGASDVGAQPVDATLTALAAVSTSADKLIYATGSDAFSTTTLSSYMRTVLDDADAATALATLGAQPLNSTLTSFSSATAPNSAGNWYWWGGSSWTLGVSNSHGRSLLNSASASSTRSLIGAVIGTDVLAPNGNGSGLTGITQSQVSGLTTDLSALKIETVGIHDTAPVVGVIYLDQKAQIARTINGLYGLKTTSGTATLTVKINGTAVTGLSSISVTSTAQDVAATAANVIAAGDVLTLEYTAVSSPVDLRCTLKATRT